ncbi:hypothetical protein M9458_020538, partial [Cirrhinus mrigala]
RGRASKKAAGAESRKIQISQKIKRARKMTRTAAEMQRGLTREKAKETGQKTEIETRTRAGIGRKTRAERRNGRRRRTATRTRKENEIKRGIRKGNGNLTKTETGNETRREIASVRNDGREKKKKNDTERLTRSSRTEAIE